MSQHALLLLLVKNIDNIYLLIRNASQLVLRIFFERNTRFFEKKIRNIWKCGKKDVPLHRI